jgi:hypothetical protein
VSSRGTEEGTSWGTHKGIGTSGKWNIEGWGTGWGTGQGTGKKTGGKTGGRTGGGTGGGTGRGIKKIIFFNCPK